MSCTSIFVFFAIKQSKFRPVGERMWTMSVRNMTDTGSEANMEKKKKKASGALQHSWARQRAGGCDCLSVTVLRPAAGHFFPEEVQYRWRSVRLSLVVKVAVGRGRDLP